MQPILKTTFLLLTILQHLPFILGTACTQSNALPYTKGGGDGCSASDIASDDTGCVKQYCTTGGTATSLKVCFCQAANERNCGSITEKRDEMEDSQQKRQSFNCSKDETCYTNPVDGRLFCLNKSTG